jgi:hypothetical protein
MLVFSRRSWVVSTDDFAGPLANQTNLALKAILGIRAMGEIASLTENDKDAKEFLKTSQEYMAKWEEFSFDESSAHAKLAYQLNNSWGLSTEILNLQKAHCIMHTRTTCSISNFFRIEFGTCKICGTPRK